MDYASLEKTRRDGEGLLEDCLHACSSLERYSDKLEVGVIRLLELLRMHAGPKTHSAYW